MGRVKFASGISACGEPDFLPTYSKSPVLLGPPHLGPVVSLDPFN